MCVRKEGVTYCMLLLGHEQEPKLTDRVLNLVARIGRETLVLAGPPFYFGVRFL